MANILVTGGTGFIGKHLTGRLVSQGHSVTLVGLNPTKYLPADWSGKVEVFNLDLRDRTATKILLNRRFHWVFHLAGYIDHTPFFKGGRHVLEAHFISVMNLLEVLDRTDLVSFVQVGSSDEYGNASSPLREDCREAPIAPYSVGKVAATHFLQMLAKTEGFPAVIARLFLTYGPGQDGKRFIPQIVQGCLEKRSFPSSKGDQIRDFCYIDDVIEGLERLAKLPEKRGEIFNIASGVPVSIKDVIKIVQQLCGGGAPQFGAIPYRPGENMCLYADTHLAQTRLQWKSHVSLEEGLQRTIDSIKPQLQPVI